MNLRGPSGRRQSGFTIIEVLISLVVLMFGVLGLAGLQMQAVNNSELGRYNSTAAMLASSVAATMRANGAYWGSQPTTAPPTAVTVQGTPQGGVANVVITGGPTATYVNCQTNACTTYGQMAKYDLANWGSTIANSLPVGQFALACSARPTPTVPPTTPPTTCTITISWQEKNISMHNPATGASGLLATGTVQTHSYQTLVSIP